ncbi:MAG TPA: TIGR00303 family protein [Methanobacterium sp.]
MNRNITGYGTQNNLPDLENKNPLFLCVIASTQTAKIPGITGAGATPELTDYTPAADVELIVHGEALCLPDIPQTVVDGTVSPTPAVITKASLELADIPFLVADAGAAVKPNVTFFDINHKPGENIQKGQAVFNAEQIFNRGKFLGKMLSQFTDHLFIGESTPAGTTTALGVLTAMGYDGNRKVSGSMPENPHDLKLKVVSDGLKAAGFEAGDLARDPLKAVEVVGDPMIPAVAGIAAGSQVPVTLAGGTQMTAVCAVIKEMDKDFDWEEISITTTIFVAKDETSDINYISRQIADYSIFAVDPHFEKCGNLGLKNYLNGSVKEGVGAGGAMMGALLKGVTIDEIRLKTEEFCEEIF